jgi:hypothetical protein
MSRVARLIVLWSRPYHLTPEQAERWAPEQVKALGVPGAVLTRLDGGCDWDWLLEIETTLPAGPWLDEWLGDLRLLGSSPTILVAGERIPLEEA